MERVRVRVCRIVLCVYSHPSIHLFSRASDPPLLPSFSSLPRMYGALPFLATPNKQGMLKDTAKLWSISFVGNGIASVTFAACAASWLFYSDPVAGFAAGLAMKKCR